MPLVPERKSSPAKAARGVEPLRRKRVEPEPAASPLRRKVLNVILGFATVVLMADALVGDKGLMERMRARTQYESQAGALQKLRNGNAAMREQIRRLKDEPSAVEAIARQELGLIRPGEVVFILRDVKPAGRPAVATSGDSRVKPIAN